MNLCNYQYMSHGINWMIILQSVWSHASYGLYTRVLSDIRDQLLVDPIQCSHTTGGIDHIVYFPRNTWIVTRKYFILAIYTGLLYDHYRLIHSISYLLGYILPKVNVIRIMIPLYVRQIRFLICWIKRYLLNDLVVYCALSILHSSAICVFMY